MNYCSSQRSRRSVGSSFPEYRINHSLLPATTFIHLPYPLKLTLTQLFSKTQSLIPNWQSLYSFLKRTAKLLKSLLIPKRVNEQICKKSQIKPSLCSKESRGFHPARNKPSQYAIERSDKQHARKTLKSTNFNRDAKRAKPLWPVPPRAEMPTISWAYVLVEDASNRTNRPIVLSSPRFRIFGDYAQQRGPHGFPLLPSHPRTKAVSSWSRRKVARGNGSEK